VSRSADTRGEPLLRLHERLRSADTFTICKTYPRRPMRLTESAFYHREPVPKPLSTGATMATVNERHTRDGSPTP
jgi:hypothetical protein